MSSKISHPPGGLPHAAPSSKPQTSAKGAPRPNVRRRGPESSGASGAGSPSEMAHGHGFEESELFGGDKREQPQGEGRSPDRGDRRTGPQSALAPPQTGGSPRAQLQRAAAAAEGRRPEHDRWAQLIAQASPENLEAGQALLGQHQAALSAFAKLLPGFAKGR